VVGLSSLKRKDFPKTGAQIAIACRVVGFRLRQNAIQNPYTAASAASVSGSLQMAGVASITEIYSGTERH
jgi:hypothetical protein